MRMIRRQRRSSVRLQTSAAANAISKKEDSQYDKTKAVIEKLSQSLLKNKGVIGPVRQGLKTKKEPSKKAEETDIDHGSPKRRCVRVNNIKEGGRAECKKKTNAEAKEIKKKQPEIKKKSWPEDIIKSVTKRKTNTEAKENVKKKQKAQDKKKSVERKKASPLNKKKSANKNVTRPKEMPDTSKKDRSIKNAVIHKSKFYSQSKKVKKPERRSTTATDLYTFECEEDTVSVNQRLFSTKRKKSEKQRPTPLTSAGSAKTGKASKISSKKRPFWETFTNIKPRNSSAKRRKTSDSVPKRIRSDTKPQNKMVKRLIRSSPKVSDDSTGDSGVFMSPDIRQMRLISSMSTPNLSPVPLSTPQEAAPNEYTEIESDLVLNNSLFSQHPPSPARKVLQPLDILDALSPPKLNSPIAEHTFSKISMADLDMKERAKRRRKGRYSTARLEHWAQLKNSEFEEFDSYELSID